MGEFFPPDAATAIAGAVLFLLALLALRRRWARRGVVGRHVVLAGWALILCGMALYVAAWSGERGTAFGVMVLGLLAYAVIAAGIQLRPERLREVQTGALEPEERRTNWTRAVGKAFLAIVLSGIAAIGLGLAFAVGMPLETPDRIVIGGVLVPLLWGAGMAWTLCDAKLLRATGLLLAATAVGYAIAFLPKVLS